MAKLVHKKKTILDDMAYATSILQLSNGLMFASKKRIKKGIVLPMPVKKDVRYGCAVTMYFVFSPLQIIFVNTKFKVVDKVTLKPWKSTYIPKAPAKYVIEGEVGTFDKIKVGDKVSIIRE